MDKNTIKLKSGNFDYIELPPFNSADIPELMFRNPDSATLDNDLAHQEAVKAYQDYWNSNSSFQ